MASLVTTIASSKLGYQEFGFKKGWRSSKWSDIDMAASHFLEKAHFLCTKKEGKSEKPFFLYLCNAAAHNVPAYSHPRFVGNFGMGL